MAIVSSLRAALMTSPSSIVPLWTKTKKRTWMHEWYSSVITQWEDNKRDQHQRSPWEHPCYDWIFPQTYSCCALHLLCAKQLSSLHVWSHGHDSDRTSWRIPWCAAPRCHDQKYHHKQGILPTVIKHHKDVTQDKRGRKGGGNESQRQTVNWLLPSESKAFQMSSNQLR